MNSIVVDGICYTREEARELAARYGSNGPEYLAGFWSFVAEWFNEEEYVYASTSGSTGVPKKVKLLKQHMVNSATTTCDALGLKQGDKALLCLSAGYIAGKMMVVRAIVRGLNLTVTEPVGTPCVDQRFAFSAMVPMQVFNLLSTGDGVAAINRIEKLIIGGGAVSGPLQSKIELLDTLCYSTYGMTETVSHIALRRLNGSGKETSYHPVGGVTVSVDGRGCLVIDAPGVCPEQVITNDIAEILPDGSFTITGRYDNVINTGGVKVMAEAVEAKLASFITVPFAITSVKDERLGEMVVLAVEGEASFNAAEAGLTIYETPKLVVSVPEIPTLANGKTDRIALKNMVGSLL